MFGYIKLFLFVYGKVVDVSGSIVFYCVVIDGKVEIIEVLFKVGVDLRVKDIEKMILIYFVCIDGNFEVVKLLFEYVDKI